MQQQNDMANTESLPLKITSALHDRLSVIATARSTDMQSVARELLEAGAERIVHEYTLAACLLRGQQTDRESSGSGWK